MRPWGGWRRAVAAVSAATALGTSAGHAASLPGWADRAAAQPTPEWAAGAPALLLHDEQWIQVPRRGRVRILVRGAVRVLSARGASRASSVATFSRGTSEVQDFRAWVRDERGDIRTLGQKDAVEVATAGERTLYSDERALVLAAAAPRPGTVFAWEYSREEEPLLAQWPWFFRTDIPSLRSRVSLTLPEGLEPDARRFAAEALAATRNDRTWTWEMRDLAAIPDEPLAPSLWSAYPSLMITLRGVPAGSPAGVSFEDWTALARWLDRLAAPQGRVTPAIEARARAAAARDTLARYRALAREVQALNYVAIELGLGRGWGYRPNAADEVLRLGYGDCKDKSNLLRTLVLAAGGKAWLMPVYSADRDRVDERWPSPRQFNHCIVAIQVPRSSALPASFEHPRMGSLLAFDPTDPITVFGDLPAAEQGSLALLVDSLAGGLVRLPEAAASSRMVRKIHAELDPEGGLTARFVEFSTGQRAAQERTLRRSSSAAEYRATLERWLNQSSTAVTLSALETVEDSLAGTFELAGAFASPMFARLQGRSLLTFRAALVTPRLHVALPDSARTRPIALNASCLAETIVVRLPQGFAVEELPDTVHFRRDFATLDAEWQVAGDTLLFTHEWTAQPLTLPPNRYREVRDMVGRDVAVSRAVVVLSRR